MTGATEKGDVLRVAYPRACNTQQTGQNDATGRATTTQHTGLKALAQLALTRNNGRNTAPQDAPKTTQQTGCPEGAFVARNSNVVRTRLLGLVTAEGINPKLIQRLSAADLDACDGLPDDVLRAYVLALDDAATRQAGKVPLDDTAAMNCRQCGSVWTHPDIAAVLPVVDGWPRALGCPWCAVRKAGGYIPRPPVVCHDCRHFKRDAINPAAGFGTCSAGHGTHWSLQRHGCASFEKGDLA